MALADYPELAGTASSVLGYARFGLGGIAAPLVGIGGGANVLPLGIVTVASILLAAADYASLVRGRRPGARDRETTVLHHHHHPEGEFA